MLLRYVVRISTFSIYSFLYLISDLLLLPLLQLLFRNILTNGMTDLCRKVSTVEISSHNMFQIFFPKVRSGWDRILLRSVRIKAKS